MASGADKKALKRVSALLVVVVLGVVTSIISQ